MQPCLDWQAILRMPSLHVPITLIYLWWSSPPHKSSSLVTIFNVSFGKLLKDGLECSRKHGPVALQVLRDHNFCIKLENLFGYYHYCDHNIICILAVCTSDRWCIFLWVWVSPTSLECVPISVIKEHPEHRSCSLQSSLIRKSWSQKTEQHKLTKPITQEYW